MFVKLTTLFQLRCAAADWLQDHPNNPNAPSVREALIETNDNPVSAERTEEG